MSGTSLAHANADLVLNHTVDKASAAATEEVTYTLRVTNNGPDTSEGIVLTNNLPATTDYVSHTTDQGSCSHSAGTLTCNIGTLANSAEAIVTLTAVITNSTPTTIVNTASVDATTPDPDMSNNEVLRNVTVTSGTDLEMLLSGNVDPVDAGGVLTYTASVDNLGPDTAVNLSSTIQLAPGFTRTGSLPAGCNQAAQTVTCTTGSLTAGTTWNIGAITGVVSVAGPSQITTTATVGSDTFDGNDANNTAIVTTDVNDTTDVSVTMTRTGGSLVQLDEFIINLNPRYSGGQPQDLTMTANIDPAFEILTAGPFSQNGWDCTITGQQVECTRANGGGSTDGEYNYNIGQVSIDVRAIAFGNNLPNSVSISATSPTDTNLDNNTDDLPITVQEPNFDLEAIKWGPTHTLRVVDGEDFPFTLRVRNNSNVAFVGELTMTDTLPAGLRVDSYFLNGWSCTPPAPVDGPATITCSRTYTDAAPLQPGAQTDAVVLNTTVTAVGDHTNEMCVSNAPAPGYVYPADSNPGNDCASTTVEGQLDGDSADIQVIKTGDATVVAGDVLTYQIEIVNAGPSTANSVTLTDNFGNLFTGGPDNGFEGASVAAGTATFDSCTNATPANVSNRNLSCTFTEIPVCSQGTDCPVVTVQVRPMGNTSTGTDLNRSNTASAYSSTTSDPVYGNNEDSHDTTVTPRADISADKTANWAENPDPIPAGTNLTYTITVRNELDGASGASDVSITDTLPEDVTFVSATASGGGSCPTTPDVGTTTTSGNNEVVCEWSSIQRNGQRTVTIVVRPNHGTQGSNLLNEVTSTTATPEVTLANNNDDVTVPVAEAVVDLATTQVDAPDPLQIGDTVVYTLTVTNFGPSVAEDVRLYNVLPTEGLSFQGFQYEDINGDIQPGLPPGISCPTEPNVGDFGKIVDRVDINAPYWTNGEWDPDLNNADIICDVADLLEMGDSVSFQMLLQGESSGVFTNYAISRSRENREGIPDINPTNDTEPENTTVRTRADMEVVSKTANPGSVALFEPFEYTILIRNNGPNEALGVELNDNFPAGMELTGSPVIVVDQGSFSATSCTGDIGDAGFDCDLGDVSEDAAATVTVPVRLTSASTSPVVNTATVNITGLTFDEDPTNNDAEGPVDVLVSSLAGLVYHDVNLNGVHDAGEPGIAGVTLTLTGTDNFGNPVNRDTTTNTNGEYLFDNLAPGTYTVTETQPAGWVDGQETIGSEGGDNPVSDVISDIVLAAGIDAVNYDFGEFTPASVASISGFVYHDANNDGVFDPGESPIQGVTITLTGPVSQTTTTDANGLYQFINLPPGEYTLRQTQPSGWTDGIDTPGTVAELISQSDDEFVVRLDAGDHAENWNFGELMPPPETDMEVVSKAASISTVALFEPFEYTISIRNNGPDDALDVVLNDTFPAGMELTGSPTVSVASGTFSSTTCSGDTADTVFTCDLGDVSHDAQATINVPVRLTSAVSDTVINTASVNVNGPISDRDPNNDSNDGPVTVQVSSLSGRVYHDINMNGQHDPGEPGIPDVTITLTGTDNFGNDVERTTVTDSSGEYLFDNLAPGSYTVTETHPAGWEDGQETVGSEGGDTPTSDVISDIVLAAGVDAVNYNFGEFLSGDAATISGFVYHDVRNDGVFDAGDPPIEGVTITISGPVNYTTTTDANGFYQFINLPPGEYTLRQTQPAGWIDGIDTPGTVAELISQSDDEFVIRLEAGDHAENWNFGEFRFLSPQAIPTAGIMGMLALLMLMAGIGWRELARRTH